MNRILRKTTIALVAWGSIILSAQAQTANKWEKNIVKFEEQDKVNPPSKKNLIVFTGSSSIVYWKSLAEDFPGYNIINRGFGGSRASDLVLYTDRVISVYNPKQVFIYEGDNDISGGRKAEEVLKDFTTIFNQIRAKNKKTEIVFISIKPSPSRRKHIEEIKKANALIEEYIKEQRNAKYVDIYNPMLDVKGNMIPALYRADSLHLTPAGYKIWADAVRPVLK